MSSGAAWTSNLSVAEFDVVASVGFRPLGQVMGTCVYDFPRTGTSWCGGNYRPGYAPSGADAAPLIRSMYDARALALGRLRDEAAALGADGVVGVDLTVEHFPDEVNALTFQAIGTAVLASGAERAPVPFLSDLKGQDLAMLLRGGWVPTGIAMGVGVVVRHDDVTTLQQRRRLAGNTEITGYTRLVQETWQSARAALELDVSRLGGDGVVVRRRTMQVYEQECIAVQAKGARDHVAELTILGTAITGFARTPGTSPTVPDIPPITIVPVLRVNPRGPRGAT